MVRCKVESCEHAFGEVKGLLISSRFVDGAYRQDALVGELCELCELDGEKASVVEERVEIGGRCGVRA